MAKSFVALDLETTGLEPKRDAIIEIGAVKFRGERVEDEFATLVNPGRSIPPFITQLTGIRDSMVAQQPRLSQVLPQLADFVGDLPVVGHNVKFDLDFLRPRNILKYNDVLDTYELASALLPSAGRYNLGALGKLLGISLPATHRALDDCRVTVAVYRALFRKAMDLPLELLGDIVQLSEQVEWGGDVFFQEVLRARSKEKVPPRRARGPARGPLFAGDGGRDVRPLQRKSEITALDVDELAALLEHAGPFARHFPNYEFRAEQVQMLRSVARAFSEGRHLLVEAGTGTGKCLTADAQVALPGGRRASLGALCQAGGVPKEPILSVAASGELIYQTIAAVHANGVRPVWRLQTASGRSLTATANHPLLTPAGWRPLAALQPGDPIAALRQAPDHARPHRSTGSDGPRGAPAALAAVAHPPAAEVFWDQITALDPAGQAATFDLTMAGEPNFIANGLVVHNSVAYLIPAAQWALQNNERVVVSTNTLNLQDQLVHKDIPDLQHALGLNFRAAVLKGRNNYLCPRRMDNMRRHGPKTAEEMRVLVKVLVWLNELEERAAPRTGWHIDLSLSGPNERAAWLRLSAEDEGCTAEMCHTKMDGICPFYRAHRAAEAAHVIIVNHALLLADIASENRVLPEFHYLIVDEAHHLESATTDGLSFSASRADLERRLKELGGPNAGLLGQLLGSTRAGLPPDLHASFEAEAARAYSQATTALELAYSFFQAVTAFVDAQREGQVAGEYAQHFRIVPATRQQPQWERVEVHWDDLGQTLSTLSDSLARLGIGLTELAEYEIDERDDLASALSSAARHFLEACENIAGLVVKPNPAMIYWIQVQPDGVRVSLHVAPLHVGPLVEKHLWHTKDSIVMTSATLTTAGEFDYLKGRLNAGLAEEIALGSPFDYETSTLVYIPDDFPEPHERIAYQRAVEKGLIALCSATRGRALVLFTSYNGIGGLNPTAQAIRDPLARAGVEVYAQADGSSRTMLLDSFRTSQGGVLLGTRSFWEGVDVPGEALSLLVIVKLPFDVPTDPIVAARSETFERPFNEYNLPEAVLRFRQGFGRLIRSKSDRGVVAIFDRRVLTKQYGRVFLDSLPACTLRRAPLAQLPREAVRWIDGG